MSIPQKDNPEQVYQRFKKEFDEQHKNVDALVCRHVNFLDLNRREKYAKKRLSLRHEQLLCEYERNRLERQLQAIKQKITAFDEQLRQLDNNYQTGMPIV